MPGKYSEPAGRVLLAWVDEQIVGGVALRPLEEEGICEMKRLFVRECWRGNGLGLKLLSEIIRVAKLKGYSKIRLDTEKRLEAAIELYRRIGFITIDRYYDNPLEDIIYMEKELD